MAKELVFTVYEYDELAEKAKQKALKKLFDINVEFDDWYTLVYEEQSEKLLKMGFIDIEFAFSGFWSQGDGASFTCKNFDVNAWLRFHKKGKEYRTLVNCLANGAEVTGCITRHSSHYVHEHSTSFSLDANYYGTHLAVETRFDAQIEHCLLYTSPSPRD